jgi:hypothetical protein
MPDKIPPANPEKFKDPGRTSWIWYVYLVLFLAILPLWPTSGLIFGLPTWAVLSVVGGATISLFTIYVLLYVWRDEEDHARN